MDRVSVNSLPSPVVQKVLGRLSLERPFWEPESPPAECGSQKSLGFFLILETRLGEGARRERLFRAAPAPAPQHEHQEGGAPRVLRSLALCPHLSLDLLPPTEARNASPSPSISLPAHPVPSARVRLQCVWDVVGWGVGGEQKVAVWAPDKLGSQLA